MDTEGLEPSKVRFLNPYAVPFATNPHVQIRTVYRHVKASAERRGNALAIVVNCPKPIYQYPHALHEVMNHPAHSQTNNNGYESKESI